MRKIEELYEENKKIDEIAELLVIPRKTVVKCIVFIQTQETIQEVKRLYKSGKTIKEIAEQLEISLPTVKAHIKRPENKRNDRRDR